MCTYTIFGVHFRPVAKLHEQLLNYIDIYALKSSSTVNDIGGFSYSVVRLIVITVLIQCSDYGK